MSNHNIMNWGKADMFFIFLGGSEILWLCARMRRALLCCLAWCGDMRTFTIEIAATRNKRHQEARKAHGNRTCNCAIYAAHMGYPLKTRCGRPIEDVQVLKNDNMRESLAGIEPEPTVRDAECDLEFEGAIPSGTPGLNLLGQVGPRYPTRTAPGYLEM
jgi:hypothetical protein